MTKETGHIPKIGASTNTVENVALKNDMELTLVGRLCRINKPWTSADRQSGLCYEAKCQKFLLDI